MRVLVAMSGGVDSSVAAALLRDAGHDVVGVTLRLWGGESDTGCCSVSDVDDARRVAQQLDIDHHVFNFADDFDAHVVTPYVEAHRTGRTPNPCIECNRHLKFDRLLRRADDLGFETIATGHHARFVTGPDGLRRVARGEDRAKDQSYVLGMLTPSQLDRVVFPVGDRTKAEVRRLADDLGLRTADKPDSQDVCFITSTGGRSDFLGRRLDFHPAEVRDGSGQTVGNVAAVELVTVGQRKGLGLAGGAPPQYVTEIDAASRTVTVGSKADLLTDRIALVDLAWTDGTPTATVLAQCSAHGRAAPARVEGSVLLWDEPQRRIAPGQTVVLYDGAEVVGSALVA